MDARQPPQEERARELETRLATLTKAHTPEVMRAHRWEYQVMRWGLQDKSLRTQILRFIDCLPALTSSRQVVRHLREFFPTSQHRLPLSLRLGLQATRSGVLTASLVYMTTHHTAQTIARRFLAGSNLEEAAKVLGQLEQDGFLLTCDLLGEATTSQVEAERYTQSYLDLLSGWNTVLSSTPHVSLKLSSLAFPFDPVDPEGAWRQVWPRLARIFQAAFSRGGLVNIDMEQYRLKNLVMELSQRAIKAYGPKKANVGMVIQAYLKEAPALTEETLAWAKTIGVRLTVRLVRGAYWDSEIIQARQQNWPCPVHLEKSQTDAAFDRLAEYLLDHHDEVQVAIATHNAGSIARAIAYADERRVPQEHWELQMLYGMSEPLARAVLQLGRPIRIYAPIGALIPGMAYLVRRILENTSQYSFLAHAY